jgi:hypothetical protein
VGDERELKLNSIDRYVKESPNFVLEEHSHCEVPAGCGGVVLRWRNPMAPVPVKLQLWLSVDSHAAYIDGGAPSSSRPSIRPGGHVLMIAAKLQARQAANLLFRAVADLDSPTTILTSQPYENWRWTDAEPAREAWEQTDFDPSEWNVLKGAVLSEHVREVYLVRRLLDAGAVALTTPRLAGAIWIRTTFDVPRGM